LNNTNGSPITEVHNDLLGHNGFEVTKARLKQQKKEWHGMNKEIKKYLKSCPCCQKNNDAKNKAIAFPYTVSSGKPGDKIQIDFITGLTADDYGITSILVVIDCMSRWVELYNLPSLSAEATVDCLVQYCGRFGIPKVINMDNDPVLKAKIIKQLMQILGLNAIYNIAHSSEENGIVERLNKEVFRHIRNFIFDRGKIRSYSRYTPLVSRIINSSKHKSTGFTPAQILYGNSVDLNRMTILQDSHLATSELSYDEYIQELKDHQDWIITKASKTLKEKDEVHMINYPSNQSIFEVGSYVLAEYTNVFRRGPSSKLLPFLKGPLKVMAKEQNKYTLLDLTTGAMKNYHIKRLSQFNFDPLVWDPITIAVRDTGDLFKVERISDMQGKPTGSKKQLFFKVHWVGLSDAEATWEPWGNLRNNISLIEFLQKHTLKTVRNLVPKDITILPYDESDEETFD
jgi:hypothetical protein